MEDEPMDGHLSGSWEEFEGWLRNTIESDFRWKVRSPDTRLNREMIADLIPDTMKHNEGVFPKSNAFIERVRTSQQGFGQPNTLSHPGGEDRKS